MPNDQVVDEFIDADLVEVSPRGRHKILDADLLAILKQVTPETGVVLKKAFGSVSKKDRPTVSATIRKHWGEVRSDEVRIDFSPKGFAQVRVRA
jgi:hypothetical protein